MNRCYRAFLMAILGVALVGTMCGCSVQKSHQTEIDTNAIELGGEDDLQSTDTEVLEANEVDTAKTIVDEATLKENSIQLISDIQFWEYECLYNFYDTETEKTIDFNTDSMEKARLATLITEVDASDVETEKTFFMSGVDVKESAQKIFASEVDFSALPAEGDLVKRFGEGSDSRPVRIVSNYDDEGIFHVLSQDVEEVEDGYVITQNLYCGYWGAFDEVHGNYEVTLHTVKSEGSYYGVILSDMSFRKIDMVSSTENEYEPFYGIWCCGVKDEASAIIVVDDLVSKGCSAYLLISSDWSNLNSEKWYVVTAGKYASESEAKDALANVKALGYGDAYVKYSGDYRGEYENQ